VFAQGLWPNCFRCAIMTASQLASYDIFKAALQAILGDKSERTATHLSASLLASLIATTLVSPMDVIRTRMMTASQRASLWVTLRGVLQADGLRWRFRGWVPSFVRLGPQTVATLVFLEQHRKVYRSCKMYEAVWI
jgi:dicarboxylate transporter 10